MSACPIALPSAVGGMGNGRFFAIPSVCFSIPCPALMLESRRRVYCMAGYQKFIKTMDCTPIGGACAVLFLAPNYYRK